MSDNGDNPISTVEKDKLESILKDAQDTLDMEVGRDSYSTEARLGVLQRLVTAVKDSTDYMQILLTAAFDDKREALLCADAISERQRYGVDIQPILNRICSQCSVKSDRVRIILEAMTHYTLNTNYPGKMPDWKRKQESKAI